MSQACTTCPFCCASFSVDILLDALPESLSLKHLPNSALGGQSVVLDAVSGKVRLGPEEKQGGSKDNVLNVKGLDAAKFSTVVPKNCLLNSVARKDKTVMTTWAWSHKLSWAEPKFSICKWVEKALPLME